jgi:two-component system chemotaxis response regulator CheB
MPDRAVADRARVLIVDDSPSVRRIVDFVLGGDPNIDVIGHADHGGKAVELATRLRPDVVVLDVEMPIVDGITALPDLRKLLPDARIVLFSEADPTSDRVYQALQDYGAHFVPKPRQVQGADDAVTRLRRSLLPQVLPARQEPTPSDTAAAAGPAAAGRRPVPSSSAPIDAVLIGSSTGGPRALAAVLTRFPAEFPAPVFVSNTSTPTSAPASPHSSTRRADCASSRPHREPSPKPARSTSLPATSTWS